MVWAPFDSVMIGPTDLIQNAKNAFQNMQGLASAPTVSFAESVFSRLDEALEGIWAAREQNLPKLVKVLQSHGIDWTPPPFGIFGAFSQSAWMQSTPWTNMESRWAC